MKLHRVLTVVIGAGLAAAGLAADDGRIEIGPTDTFPIVIDSPGSYILTTDLEVVDENVHAIEIRGVGDITLDLGGHVIRGPCSGGGYGITIPTGQYVSGFRVRNGIVTCFCMGLRLRTSVTLGGIIVENISVTNSLGLGISAQHALIIDSNAYGNGGHGIAASFSTIRDCVSNGNGGDGIAVQGGVVSGSTAHGNDGDGIELGGTASQVAFCSVADNDGYGINMAANGNNNISHSAGSNNGAGNVINCGVGNGCHHNMLP